MRHASRMMQIACIVILSLIGWSTQPGHAAPSADAFSEVYRLPDGTFAVICSENSRHEPGTAAIHCDHCMLAGPVALPAPVSNGWILEPRWDIARPALPRQPPSDTLTIDRATSRGPPSHV
ncbi:hypothetical protein SAMN03159496_03223 [Rhizobium sp. NFR07]|uniref:hypothetical protein n=1 Tax=Rhizobium sp. NFR07 TaxID=1566262 RepID=UPI0008E1BBA8|nr:hypothetical protein [Rhizobium sp. NFR07]SFB37518.1 hypothetical protein SAMN03159496_03223 [Rhizobium sp. NFR07]